MNPAPLRTIIRKSADQTVNNSAALVADSELLYPAPASSFWMVDFLLLLAAANAVADWQFALSLPAGASARWGSLQGTGQVPAWGGIVTTTAPIALVTDGNAQSFGGAAINPGGFWMRAIITIGATAGNVGLRWAQAVADPSNSQVLANSLLVAQRVP